MPLTRNLYREDEVIASLQLSILRGRHIEAVFWATELLESQMATEFLDALKTIWVLGFGIAALSWYAEFKRVTALDVLDQDALIGLVIGLSRNVGRDITHIVLAGSTLGPEQVNLCMVPKGLVGADSFFAAAIAQGRTVTAWRALPSIQKGTLDTVGRFKHGTCVSTLLDLYEEYPGIVIAALCLPRGELEKRLMTEIPGHLNEVIEAIEEWEGLNGRARRVYTIPYDALYWLTARGHTDVYTSSDSHIRGSLERPDRLWGSVYWDSVVEEIGGWQAVRSDDDVREAFYEAHFPGDIPDEWSSKARGKSHGNGCLQRGGVASLQRFLKTWFAQYSSAVIWDQFDAAIKNIDVKKLAEITVPIGAPVTLNLERYGRRSFTVV